MTSRREFVSAAGAVAATSLAGPALARARRLPNVVFLLADDLRHDGVGYLNPMVETPNIDRLSREGVTFSNAFVATSICCTSRATLLSGLYARRHNVWDFKTPLQPAHLAQSYPAVLKRAGYRTGYFGKYGVGDASGLSEADHALFDEMVTSDHYYEREDVERQEHHNRRMGDLATAFIERADPNQPFCMTVGFKAPHAEDAGDPVIGPYVAEPDMLQLYVDDIFTQTTSMNDEAFQALPSFIQTSEARRRWVQRFSTPELWQDSVRKYFALVTGMDRAIGRVLQALDARNMMDDTLIVFMSDNGYFLGDYGLEGKWFGYEASVRVPLVIRTPGGADRRSVDSVVMNVDIAPTILDAVGLETPSSVYQGRSLLPAIKGRRLRDWRSDFLYEHYLPGLYGYSRGFEAFIPSSEGVRGERYTYLRFPRQEGPNELLFDRVADSEELKNIAQTADPELVRTLRRRTDELIAQAA